MSSEESVNYSWPLIPNVYQSTIDPASGSNSNAISFSNSSNTPLEPSLSPPTTQALDHTLIRGLFSIKEESPLPQDVDVSEDFSAADDSTDEQFIIVEPLSPRVRMRSERPLSSVSDNHLSYYQSSRSTTRLSDIPTRLSGWLEHAFNSSATDLSLPHLINSGHLPSPSGSPKGKSSALLTAAKSAKYGKGHLSKAMRYLLDSDSTPYKCTDPIWLLGVQHPGCDPSAETPSPTLSCRGSVDSRRASSFRSSIYPSVEWPETSSLTLSRCSSIDSRRASSFRSSIYSTLTVTPGGGNALSSSSSKDLALHWQPEFYADFTSCVWITCRSQFQPIRDSSLTVLEREQAEIVAAAGARSPTLISSGPPSKRWWPGGEKGWTSDTGWGCMLRTGQSLLATALIHLHLGRGT